MKTNPVYVELLYYSKTNLCNECNHQEGCIESEQVEKINKIQPNVVGVSRCLDYVIKSVKEVL